MLGALQPVIHYGMHFVLPLWIAYRYYRPRWGRAYLILLLTMLIDLDHLLASPIFQPDRCSLCAHPLHSPYLMLLYVGLIFPKRTRLIGLGLSLHIITDFTDCLMSGTLCY